MGKTPRHTADISDQGVVVQVYWYLPVIVTSTLHLGRLFLPSVKHRCPRIFMLKP